VNRLRKLLDRLRRGMLEQRIYSAELMDIVTLLSHIQQNGNRGASVAGPTVLLLHGSDAFILRSAMMFGVLPKADVMVIGNVGAMQDFLAKKSSGERKILMQKSLFVRYYALVLHSAGDNVLVG